MPKTTKVVAEEPEVKSEVMEEVKTSKELEPEKVRTNYAAFKNAGIWPVNMVSKAYKPMFPADTGTHTKILVNLENIKRYADPTNPAGAGFIVQFRRAKNVCPIWDELATNAIEVLDLTCDHCQKKLAVHSQTILEHYKSHKGSNRKARQPYEPIKFRMTFGVEAPRLLEMEANVEDEGPQFID